jgi:hypothetical protein
MIPLLITLLILAGIVGVAWWAINQVPMPPPIRILVVVIMAIIVIIVLLSLLPGAGSFGALRLGCR